MSRKSKKIPQINYRISVNIGDIVSANLLSEKDIIGVVTRKVLRLESYSHGERMNDLITVIMESGKEKTFDRSYITSVSQWKLSSNNNYTNTVYGDNGDFTRYDTLVVKTKKDIYESISLKYLILFFGRRIYKKNPKDVPMTYIDDAKLYKIDLTTIPGIKSFGSTNTIFAVRGKIFEKWVRRNIFRISKTYFKTWKYNTSRNQIGLKSF